MEEIENCKFTYAILSILLWACLYGLWFSLPTLEDRKNDKRWREDE